jgi:hypothetical protein
LALSKTLIGSWELLSRTDVTHDGERRVDPSLGADPVGLLIYDAAGHFSAQFMKRDRSAAVEGPRIAGPNNSRAVGGYDAYFGTYVVDDATGEVTQVLTGALSPESVGMTLTRVMQVSGDDLVIRLETASADGTPVVRTLAWKRVG